MKTTFIISAVFLLFNLNSNAQENKDLRIPMIGEFTPGFTVLTTLGKINFPDDYFGKWKIILSHPADFTPVCTSEMIELASLQQDFKDLNTAILVISTDGINSHLEWIRSIESIVYKNHKNIKIEFPLISDAGLEVSEKFGMLHPYSSSTKDIRGVFIIDPENKIQAMFFYPSTVGRNMDEIKRTLIALQMHDKNLCLTPANWKPGDDVMIPSPTSATEAQKLRDKKDSDLSEIAWYMWFKKNKQ